MPGFRLGAFVAVRKNRSKVLLLLPLLPPPPPPPRRLLLPPPPPPPPPPAPPLRQVAEQHVSLQAETIPWTSREAASSSIEDLASSSEIDSVATAVRPKATTPVGKVLDPTKPPPEMQALCK